MSDEESVIHSMKLSTVLAKTRAVESVLADGGSNRGTTMQRRLSMVVPKT